MTTVSPPPTRRTRTASAGRIPEGAVDRVKAATDLVALVQADGIALRREGHEMVACCPFHQENTPSFHVAPEKRIYHCFGCGENGDAVSWLEKRHGMGFLDAVRELARRAGIDLDGSAPSPGPPTRRTVGPVTPGIGGGGSAPPKESKPRGPTPFDWRPDLADACRADLDTPDGAPVLEYLTGPDGRRLSREAVEHFGLGALIVRRPDGSVRGRYVSIPCRDRRGRVTTVRFRSVPGPCLECAGAGGECRRCKGTGQTKKMFAHCPDRDLPLFNVGSLSADPGVPVAVTEGELDVVAAWDLGLRENIVSGTGGAGNFQDVWYDELEPYRAFVLLYDGDAAGDDGAKTVADRLGKYRCARARLPEKDLGDCLRLGISAATVHAAIEHAAPMVQATFTTLSSYADKIEARIATPGTLVGLPTGSSRLDRILGGWRPGLFVLTGDSGAGKTSFVAWAIREQALRGVRTLATCFEQSPEQLAEKFLRQAVGGDFTQVSKEERAAAWAALDAMPARIDFLDHYGRIPKAQFMDAIRYAVRRLDVRVIDIDHLGYIDLGDEEDEAGITKFMIELAAFGVNEGVTLIAIAHPNRMNVAQQRRVTMRDLKGSSGIEQNAHAVLVLVRNAPGKSSPNPSATLHLDKVRSEFGTPGSACVLAYDPLSTVYADEWAMTPRGARGGSSGVVVPPPDQPEESSVVPTRRRRTVEPTAAPEEPRRRRPVGTEFAADPDLPFEDGEVPV